MVHRASDAVRVGVVPAAATAACYLEEEVAQVRLVAVAVATVEVLHLREVAEAVHQTLQITKIKN